MASLTKKQKIILDFIANFLKSKGFSPSIEEIAEGVGLNSKATVHAHVKNLREKGFLKYSFNQARTIETIRNSGAEKEVIDVPMLGLISAGKPIEAIGETDETISLPADFAGRGDTFSLKVKGDSMIDDHIVDGDYVIVKKSKIAQNGETVVALIDGHEATIKKFFLDVDKVRLEPRNVNLKPLIVAADRVAIQGIVVGILRRMSPV